MARSQTFHFRHQDGLRERLDAVRAGVEPHPTLTRLINAALDDLCTRFEAGKSIVTLTGLAALDAKQVVLKDGALPAKDVKKLWKSTKRRHLAPLAAVELYASLAATRAVRLRRHEADRQRAALELGR